MANPRKRRELRKARWEAYLKSQEKVAQQEEKKIEEIKVEEQPIVEIVSLKEEEIKKEEVKELDIAVEKQEETIEKKDDYRKVIKKTYSSKKHKKG